MKRHFAYHPPPQLILGLAIAAYFLSFFHRVAPAALTEDLTSAFHIDAAALGLLAATYFMIYTVMQIPAGILADTLGPRRTLFIGGLVAGLGSLLFGLAREFDMAFIGRALVGLGVSVVFIAMLKIVAVWFAARRFASLAGLCTLLGNCGAIAAGAPLAWLISHSSWRSVFVGAGILSLLIGTLCLLLVRDKPHTSHTETPHRPLDRTAALSGLLKVMGNRATWPGFFVNAGMAASFFSFAGLWAAPYFTHALGMSRELASRHVSLYFTGYAFGALLLGVLSDRLGQRKPLIVVGSLLHLAGWLIWLYSPPGNVLYSQLLCLGMGCVTASYTLTWACAKEVNPPLLSGMATSVVNVGVFLGPALLQPLTGWVLDQHWQAHHGILLNGVRVYSAEDFQSGLWLMAVAAALGSLATRWLPNSHRHYP